MLAIERGANRLGNTLTAEIGGEHRGPGDGLQRRPVQARCQNERHNNQDFSAARKHVAN